MHGHGDGRFVIGLPVARIARQQEPALTSLGVLEGRQRRRQLLHRVQRLLGGRAEADAAHRLHAGDRPDEARRQQGRAEPKSELPLDRHPPLLV